jgi:hypothetical protein
MTARPKYSQPTETPAAEAITVAWLVSVMMVTLLDVAAIGLQIYIAVDGATAQRTLLASYALYVAAITGVLSLLLATAVFKLRVQSPPPKVTTFSVVVAVTPIIMLIIVTLRR